MTAKEYKKYKKFYEAMKAEAPAVVHSKEYGALYKLTEERANWCLYTDSKKSFVYSIAKKGTGCSDSMYCNINHFKDMVKTNWIKKSELTRLGYRLATEK